MKRAHELAQKALAMDDKNLGVHALLGSIYQDQRQLEKAISKYKIAISLDPNLSPGIAQLAGAMNLMGEFEESITLMKKAMRLSPYYEHWYLDILATAYFFTGRYEEAIAASNQRLDRCRKGECSTWLPLSRLALVYVEFGKVEEARAFMAEALENNPKLSLAFYRGEGSLLKTQPTYSAFSTQLARRV
jgi:tetratricopeptide (TPR) repeat protein